MATTTTKQSTLKLGTSRAGERSRIWIEGAKLAAAGFPHGQHWAILVQPRGHWELVPVSADTPHARRIAGTPARPIVDITGANVHDTFGSGTHVRVTFNKGSITIEKAEG